jgi:hypothetical protein
VAREGQASWVLSFGRAKGSGSFTAQEMAATNGRDVIWSGACSSGGNKVKTCTFTIQGNASLTANVQ